MFPVLDKLLKKSKKNEVATESVNPKHFERKSYCNSFNIDDISTYQLKEKLFLDINSISYKELYSLYDSVEPLYTGLDIISKAKKNLVPYIYNKETEEYSQESDIIKFLLEPKFNQNYKELIEQVTLNKKLTGNLFIILKSTGPNKEVNELEVIRSDRVSITDYNSFTKFPAKYNINTADGTQLSFFMDTSTTSIYYPRYFTQDKQYELIHDNGINISGDYSNYMGQSKILAIYLQCQKFLKTQQHNISILDNGANSSLLVNLNNTGEDCLPITDAQVESLRTSLNNRYSGTQNAGKIIITENAGKPEKISLTEQDMQFLEGAKFDRRGILSSLGIPLALVGETITTYNGYNDALTSLYTDTAMPETQSFFNFVMGRIAKYRYPLKENEIITYRAEDIEVIRNKNLQTNVKILEIASKLSVDILTEDEKRHLLGFDKKEESDNKDKETEKEVDKEVEEEDENKSRTIRLLKKSGYDIKEIVEVINNYEKY